MTCVRVMVVARLPAGAGVHMEKSHWREYCPSVGLSQVIWREGSGCRGGGGACRPDRHTITCAGMFRGF